MITLLTTTNGSTRTPAAVIYESTYSSPQTENVWPSSPKRVSQKGSLKKIFTSLRKKDKMPSSDALSRGSASSDASTRSPSEGTGGELPSTELDTASTTSSENKLTPNDDAEFLRVQKKTKYFEASNKNILKKIIHPSYQERRAQFRKLFGNVVHEDDEFLASFSCAYQREILAQGRMYISQRNICFYANIFGWETSFAIPIDDIQSITKERAAKIFPNSIQFEMKNGEKYFFASFVNREKTLSVLAAALEKRSTGEDLKKEELWEMLNLEDDDKHDRSSKRYSKIQVLSSPTSATSPVESLMSGSDAEAASPVDEAAEIEEVCCPCESHHGRLLLDCVFPISTEELFELVFTDNPWYKRLNDILKASDFVSTSWIVDKNGVRQRTCTYTMALNHAMAPKSCVVTEKQVIEYFGRPGDGFVVHKETQNAGVPYADHFTVNCTYCVMRIGARQLRLKVHGGIVYKKNIWSMVKGFIEKNTQQGLDDHYNALESALTEECQRRSGNGKPATKRAVESDDVSLTSSVEDPVIEAGRKEKSLTPNANSRTHGHATHDAKVFTNDYGSYFKVIVILLAALLFINVLVLLRLGSLDASSAIRNELSRIVNERIETPAADQQVYSALINTVTQLSEELQKIKTHLKTEL